MMTTPIYCYPIGKVVRQYWFEKGTALVKIRDDMKLAKTCDCAKCEYENKWIEMDVDGTNFLIGSICRHPNGNVEHFVNGLENVLPKLPRHQTCFISGDININLLKFNQTMTFNYFTSFAANDFRPYISTPTCLTDTTATIIDHIFVKTVQDHMHTNMESGNLYSDITDHLPNFIMWKKRGHTGNDRPLIRIYSDKSLKSFQNTLGGSNWDSILTGGNSDEIYENLYNHVLKKFDECFQISHKSRKRSKRRKMDYKWPEEQRSEQALPVWKKNTQKKQLKSPSEKDPSGLQNI